MSDPLFSVFSAILAPGNSSLIGSSAIFPCPEEAHGAHFGDFKFEKIMQEHPFFQTKKCIQF